MPDTNSYLYNARSELTSATAAVDSAYRYGYDFDDIGNRKTSAERGTNSVYTASQLNQYTAVDDFTPTYDADGNETLVKTATGIWQVSYNGENRPVRWQQGPTVITMSFDRMGRRVTKNDQRFVYNGYLQIANFRSTTTTSDYNYFVWDCTENVATRPLAWQRGTSVAYYTHDGNKNVSEVIASDTDVAAHYEYAPFGALRVFSGVFAAVNPWRFSSEYAEDDTATVYYNYRHYEPLTGRWMQRDKNGDSEDKNLLLFSDNVPNQRFDVVGNDCSKLGDPYVVETKIDIGDWSPWKNKVQLINAIPHESVYPFWIPSLGLLTITVTKCECVYRYYELRERKKKISEHKKQKMYCEFGCPKTYMTYEDDLGWFSKPAETESDVRSLGDTSEFKTPLTRGNGSADCYTTCLLGTPRL